MDQEQKKWFIGYVKSCQERKVAEALAAKGEECFLPVQKVRRKYSDRIKLCDRLVLPGLIFIHTLPSRRIPLLGEIYGLYAYMSSKGPYTPVTVPDSQMAAFIAMVTGVDDRPVNLVEQHFEVGDRVRVASGPMKGMECLLTRVDGRDCLAITLNGSMSATIELGAETLEHV